MLALPFFGGGSCARSDPRHEQANADEPEGSWQCQKRPDNPVRTARTRRQIIQAGRRQHRTETPSGPGSFQEPQGAVYAERSNAPHDRTGPKPHQARPKDRAEKQAEDDNYDDPASGPKECISDGSPRAWTATVESIARR